MEFVQGPVISDVWCEVVKTLVVLLLLKLQPGENNYGWYVDKTCVIPGPWKSAQIMKANFSDTCINV